MREDQERPIAGGQQASDVAHWAGLLWRTAAAKVVR